MRHLRGWRGFRIVVDVVMNVDGKERVFARGSDDNLELDIAIAALSENGRGSAGFANHYRVTKQGNKAGK